jgi:hypothetical protein
LPDVEAFIRAHTYALDVRRMQQGHTRTNVAILESRRQAWRSCQDLAAYLGVSDDVVRDAVRRGLIPHRRRPGAGCHGEIRIRAADFLLAREVLSLMGVRIAQT